MGLMELNFLTFTGKSHFVLFNNLSGWGRIQRGHVPLEGPCTGTGPSIDDKRSDKKMQGLEGPM